MDNNEGINGTNDNTEQDNDQENTDKLVDDLLGQILLKITQPKLSPEDVERAEALKTDKKYVAKRLGEILTELGLVTEQEVESALKEQEKLRKSKKS
jgi:IMP dehydrogenase/GMP reductase